MNPDNERYTRPNPDASPHHTPTADDAEAWIHWHRRSLPTRDYIPHARGEDAEYILDALPDIINSEQMWDQHTKARFALLAELLRDIRRHNPCF